uniref:Genome polyprotein n=1 Tax=Zucchini yellow mosaic virus TaxID=12232 RepID=A0A0M3LAJ6_9POTV|nr:polyprotein [Zucchini yellow mosaic virus]
MASIMIGSISVPIAKTEQCANTQVSNRVNIVAPGHMATCPLPLKTHMYYRHESKKLMQSNKSIDILNNFFSTDEMKFRLTRNEMSKVKKGPSGRIVLRKPSKQRVFARIEQDEAARKEEAVFLEGNYDNSIINLARVLPPEVTHNVDVSLRSPFYKRTYKKERKKVAQKQIVQTPLNSLCTRVLKIARNKNIPVEMIGNKKARHTLTFKKFRGYFVGKVSVAHEEGRMRHTEMSYEQFKWILKAICQVTHTERIREEDIKPGCSGWVLGTNHTLTKRYSRLPHLVIRGRDDDGIVNALEQVLFYSDVDHYSSQPEVQFFQGWRRMFDKFRPSPDHVCKVDHNNEECGELAAIFCQALFPVVKLSCQTCREKLSRVSFEEFKDSLNANFIIHKDEWGSFKEGSQYDNIFKLIKVATQATQNLKLSSEVMKLVQNHTSTHMKQIQDINKALMKGSLVTQDELDLALKQLLEMTQWFKNHMHLTGEEALKMFRNKRSSKAMINPSLLCDNQLDKNGNFVWGERGYHSRRLFKNFFEEVIPSEGYTKYVVRNFPNGTRKLAIGSLIVPLNLDRARTALLGESIEKKPLTSACVSQQNGNYIHSCCCVTMDDGTPMYSELKSPTKRHLVIGASGDPKYIDLPASEAERMYIAKEGYCYLNIFLAMLVNVNENEAKDFTKMIRDVLIPMLGQWPSLMDVATAAYILGVFHPETRCAELPRILVDHATQTMHVIDSYGSLTVGYHVLKAGTVNHLIQFASNDLQSEMKHYRVGGTPTQRIKLEEQLIKGIFKPKLMMQLLHDDPYILLLGMISPTILVHMYRMRHFERGIEIWIKRDHEIGKIFVILEQLTRKVALAEVLVDQFNLISEASPHLLEIMRGCQDNQRAYVPALDLLTIQVEREFSNKELKTNGYPDLQQTLFDMREKMYAKQLHNSWQELSLLEKSCVTVRLKQFSIFTERNLTQRAKEGKRASSLQFVHECFITTRVHAKSIRDASVRKLNEALVGTCKFFFSCGFKIFARCYSDIIYLVNVCLVFSLVLQMSNTVRSMIAATREEKERAMANKADENERTLMHMYHIFSKKQDDAPIYNDFLEHVRNVRPDLEETLLYMAGAEVVSTQAKSAVQVQFEKIIAVLALLTMCFDAERSDAIFKILTKLKTVFSTVGGTVRLQGLEDIESLEDDKRLTIDFDINTNEAQSSTTFDVHFDDWWNRQLQQNRTVPHYRTTGKFLEFTRNTAAFVANEIASSSEGEFLVRGAVGSGKSTSLPAHLAKKGKVLLLEPTRPLAENVSRQLAGDPFFQNVTLRMRGLSCFGSSNITVMTSGFAFHYYVNNPHQLMEFDFVIIDECHVTDSATIAFNCALKEYNFAGKLIKVSATPPGRECDFDTQFAVKVKTEDHLSFHAFVGAQKTGSNADMVQHGNNILVYVASYNEVDMLSKLLTERQFSVTKVDGRTMQLGKTTIETHGTSQKPHFIVATNIIENGVTLDVECVVDFGLKVVAELDSENRCVRYNKKSVSYGERIQRLGRVGRSKPGTALRIGHTEKGIETIPEFIATEAAALSFAYGLPVTTHGVSTNILGKCTVKQMRCALNFELTPFFTTHLIRHDGSMHPLIHEELKQFKLRDSEMVLNKVALPHQFVSQWMDQGEYERIGVHVQCHESTRIPFYTNGIPDKVYERIWKCIQENKNDAVFGKLSSACSTKVSYTLSTDPAALPRTIAIIDHLLAEEMMKRNHFDTISSAVTGYSFSLAGIADSFRKRYMRDYTAHNIAILQQARAQLLEFNSKNVNINNLSDLEGIGVIKSVVLQSKQEVSSFLGLRGKWDGRKFANDVILAIMTLLGGWWVMWEYFTKKINEPVRVESKKRRTQKLKFRDAYDRKVGREIFGDDDTIGRTFGEAYTKRGKVKGNNNTKGMGRKTRNFVHLYGVEPENYSFIRFVDPLTGHTLDESTHTDISLVQEEFGSIREKFLENDLISRQSIINKPGIQAYFMGKGTEEALKVDLTPHVPLLLCRNTNAIAGYPERENELRQTGTPVKVSFKDVPEKNEHVELESKSIYKGVRDYNGISTIVCQLTNDSDGLKETMYGIGYGPIIITNGHLFRKNNGTLLVRSWHGEFIVKNTTTLKVHFIEGKDVVLVRMPKDFPPFKSNASFRAPKREERACLVGTNFQEKSLRSTVSESSMTIPEGTGSYWIHWISTNEGDCGLPMVSTTDGKIIGVHGLASTVSSKNYFVPFTDDFIATHLSKLDDLTWTQHWLWQPSKIAWGTLNLVDEQPGPEFCISNLVKDLFTSGVETQSKRERWVYESCEGNLRAVGTAQSALVTKHVVKGKCPFFEEYLQTHAEASAYFRPLMGEYQPSKLNKEAFKKDFFKYNKPVTVNQLDHDKFLEAVDGVIRMMCDFEFNECRFITDPEEIYNSLNMKAAIGAQYRGKKKEYFEGLDDFDRERLLFQSCERLFNGHKGLWNGSLKAELRPLEKVRANKTRTFTAAPIDTLLGAKVCVDDFNNEFYRKNLKCPWTVGMTKFYGGWDKLMRSLPDGWLYCHADGSQFDSSLTPALLNAVLIIRSFYMEDWWVGQEMLENLYAEIVYTPILAPDGTIFKKFRGNNSGQPSTVVDNTLMVVISIYYACMKFGWNCEEIENRLIFFANGDDLILAVKDEDSGLLDNMSSSFCELGLNYDFSERTHKREDLWFMSHQAMLVDGMYIPKLEKERIVSILEWDRSKEIMHRTEAICAAMIEAWGHTELLQEIRKFYLWFVEKEEVRELAALGKAPYIAETALRKLYTDKGADKSELARYLQALHQDILFEQGDTVMLQSGTQPTVSDAGATKKDKEDDKGKNKDVTGSGSGERTVAAVTKDKDVNAGSHGKIVPRLSKITKKMSLPRVKGNVILDIDHLLEYKPDQIELYNTRASHQQFASWFNQVKTEYDLNEQQMGVVMNGFMVWCIENGTSPDINGVWVMMDGNEQVEYPLKPIVENAKPTLRQIMHHFSDAAEAYIEMRNAEAPYMPRYGLLRNLRDRSLARYAFDFYEVNSKTPERAREAVAQMKAAALSNVSSRLFGLDGNVATTSEDTERHTARDVNRNMHTLLGVNTMQ